jgi:CsoR family transcriptional regulator, copper-sensing transcriptional repressor
MSMTAPDPAPRRDSDEERRRILNRLKRLEGQIRGLQTMVESEKDCQSVLTQVMAAKSALNQVGLLIMGRSMRECLSRDDALDKDQVVDEALSILMRYVNLPDTWTPPLSENA